MKSKHGFDNWCSVNSMFFKLEKSVQIDFESQFYHRYQTGLKETFRISYMRCHVDSRGKAIMDHLWCTESDTFFAATL